MVRTVWTKKSAAHFGDNVSARADAREALRRCPDTEKGRAKRQALEKFLAKSD